MRAGVDLGGTKIDVLLVEREREVLGRMRRPTPTEGGAAAVVTAIAQAVTDAADAASVRVDQLTGVGVGSPGAVDTGAGTVAWIVIVGVSAWLIFTTWREAQSI